MFAQGRWWIQTQQRAWKRKKKWTKTHLKGGGILPLKSFEGTVDSASVSERLETCNRDKEQGDEKSTTLACARAGGRVTDEQRNKAKAARGVFAAIARRTRGGRGASLGTNSQPPFGIVPGRAAAKNLCPLCLFLLSVFADTFIERNKHVKHLKNTIPFL
jgi:hypothetical protein